MSKLKTKSARFKLNDWVTFHYGINDVYGQIIELRGALGIGGRHIYRIARVTDPDFNDSFELSEDDISPAPKLNKESRIAFLKEGGLIQILQENLIRPTENPKVWLTYGPFGNVTHTLIPVYGIVGGHRIPYFAIHEDRIYSGKRDLVATFVRECFELSETEANEIIDSIGTAP